jgi:SAM-dependent methyltransferase
VEDTYRDDLAHIHDAGFGHFARGAALLLLEELHRSRFERGLVIDLGCGSGILAEPLSARGFDILGIDLSAAFAGCCPRFWQKPLKIRRAFPHVFVAGRKAGHHEGPGSYS